MSRVLLCLAALLPATAWGEARLIVEADRPVVIIVNLVPYPLDGSRGSAVTIDLPDGKEGGQNVRVRNLLGQEQWVGRIDVPPGRQVTAHWGMRHMMIGDPVPLGGERSEPRRLSDRPGGAPAVRGPDVPQPDAEPEEPDYGSLVGDALREGGGGAAPVDEGPPPPAEGVGSLVLRNRQTTWANVYVGEDLQEFRGEREKTLELPSGAHAITVRDFRDKELWWEGTVLVYPDEAVELHFSKADPPDTPDRPGAFTPKPAP